MGRRTVILITCVLVAVLGTFVVWNYANNADNKAEAGQEPVQVLVATEAIPSGSTVADIKASGDTELQTLPKASVPAGALSNLDNVSGLLTAVPVYPGQVLITSQFAGSDNTTALTLPKGTMAMSVELEDPQRVAGFVTPGSDVAVIATVEIEENGDGPERGRETDVIIDRVRVVAVGPTTLRPTGEGEKAKTANDEEIPTAVLTLAVTTEEAKRLASVYSNGDLHFALLNSNSQVTNGAPVTGENIWKG